MLFAFHSFLIRAPICFGVGLIAMRVAQSEAAAHVGWAPEDISPAKFFPTLAVACHLHWQEQQWERQFRRRRPPAHPHPFAAGGGPAPLPRRSRSNAGPSTDSTGASAPRAVTGNRWLMFVAADASWRSYLRGDGIKSQVLYLLS
jgi:hypothetical protein